MRFGLLLFTLGLLPGLALAQSKPARGPAAEPPLLRFVGGEQVSRAEFERVYRKNANVSKPTSPTEYLELYISFRRKVMHARALGLDTTRAFADELGGYLRQLAGSYLTERRVLDRLLDEAVAREGLEVSARHLLLRCAPDAAPADTERVYRRIVALRDSALRGQASLEALARRHSQDPSVAQNGGNLGAFSVLDMVYPFEQAAFNLCVGQVSVPVRTRFGYHLIEVTARGPRQALRRTAHLFVAARGADSLAWGRARQRIDSLAGRLAAGEAFDKLCACCSDDAATAQRGGDLGTSRLLPELEAAKRSQRPESVSAPVRTVYGWHLLRVGADEAPKPEADRRRELRQRIARDERARLAEQAFVEQLLREYNYESVPAGLEASLSVLRARRGVLGPAALDSLPQSVQRQAIGRFADQTLTVRQLLEQRLSANLYSKPMPTETDTAALRAQLEAEQGRLVRQAVLRYEEGRLTERYPDYRVLADENRDGLLMFNLMDRQVWRRAVEDSVGLARYFDARRDSFISGPRLQWRRVSGADSAQVVAALEALRAAGASSDTTGLRVEWQPEPEAVAALRAGRRACTAVRRVGTLWQGECPVGELPPAPLPLAEARPEATRRYQAWLETELNAELARRYPVTRDADVLRRVSR